MLPDKDKTPAENKQSVDPIETARLEAEAEIASDPEFLTDPASDDLDEGELAKLDNSND